MSIDYKNTLNILSTPFEMKGNLPSKEPEIQAAWLNKKIYRKVLEKNKNNEQKILHDGPPYANGSIHVGHALNKILKDILVRRWNLQGFYSDYIPGWDCHGMPIEHALIKKGINVQKELSIAEKRNNCRQFALEQIENQKKQFSRLGWMCDGLDIYRTLDNDFEYDQIKIFFQAIEKGLAYQDLKPVFWSWASQTALAEAEAEYADLQSYSIYITFDVVEGKGKIQKGDKILVWTTTPWTLPCNQAIAANPKFLYCRFEKDGETYIIAKSLLEKAKQLFGWENTKIIDEFYGNEMEHITYKHPIYNLVSPVILAEYVLESNGTGLVHNASGFGKDDYLACKKYGIKPFAPLDALCKFTDQIKEIDPSLVGIFYEDSNESIIEKLKNAKALINCEKITHSAAIDWRTKKPLVYRATKQWFIDIDTIKKEMVELLEAVQYPNPVNKEQLRTSIIERTEWCISRQRYWGVPIPIIYDENGNPIFDKELNENILTIFKKESTNVWYDKPAEYILTKKYKDGRKYTKEKDILDVWFDSGTTFSILQKRNLQYPCAVYLEGKDQFRGWFNSALICSTIANNTAPYKRLLACGFICDEKGQKMSKSLGNVVDPLDVCQKYGADVLRLWVATCNYKEDAKIGDTIIKQVGETYRKIRNTLFKFILSNISDFEFDKKQKYTYTEADNLVLSQLDKNLGMINACYEDFDFSSIVDIINNHIIELSGWYFEIIKDSLYCDEKENERRRTIQSVLWHIINCYLYTLAPIIPHTCEEVYMNMNLRNKKDSLFLEECSSFSIPKVGVVNKEKWEQFKNIKNDVYAKLEKLRNDKIINKNTQAKVEISLNNHFNWTEDELKGYLNVALVKLSQTDSNKISIQCSNANFVRCERCWNYFEEENVNDKHICPRCAKIVK